MPTWLKFLPGVLVLTIVVSAGVGCRRVSSSGARVVEQQSEARREGTAYGRGRDSQTCVGESLRRLQSSRAFANETAARLFLDGCLSAASVPASFCESLRRLNEPAAAEWAINECRNRDAEEISRCSRVLQEVLRHCDQKAARKPSGSQPNK